MDHGRRALKIRGGDFAGGDDLVHPRNQEAGKGGLAALSRPVENQREAPAQPFEQQADHHFDVAAGVPDADLVALRRAEAQAQQAETESRAIPSGASGPNQTASRFCAIKGAMVRLTAVPPE